MLCVRSSLDVIIYVVALRKGLMVYFNAERNTDFPYHPTEKRVDGTVVVRPLFEPYLTYYGISNEEALSRLKQYDAKYKT